jgi:hypothetical protein
LSSAGLQNRHLLAGRARPRWLARGNGLALLLRAAWVCLTPEDRCQVLD